MELLSEGFFFKQIHTYLEFLRGRKLAIWGMGNLGTSVKWEMDNLFSWKKYNLHIECFDSQKDDCKKLEEFEGEVSEYYVLICFLQDYEKAEETLNRFGYKEVYDYVSLGKFSKISNNSWPPSYVYQANITNFPKAINEKLMVLGDGPSLLISFEDNKEVFLNHDCMCVNGMAFTKLYEIIKPKYYVMADPVYWCNEDELDDNISVKKEVCEIFRQIINKTTWNLLLFVPYSAKFSCVLEKRIEKNCYIKIVYVYDYICREDAGIKYKLYDKCIAMPHYQNVLVFALFLGIRMEYKKIYLFGADHSWTKSLDCDQNGIYIQNKHTYNVDGEKQYINTFFGKEQNVRLMQVEQLALSEYLYCLSLMFKGYEEIEEYAEYKKVKIFNSTPESFIDAFPRKIPVFDSEM